MASIEQLLHRRSDLSTFLVHFTRANGPVSSYDNLLNILSGWTIEARTVFGMATALAKEHPEIADSQKAVCFTETPLEHAWMMCSQIDGRNVEFDGYGVAFTKTYARRRGANPVWYLDMTPGRSQDFLTRSVQGLVNQAEAAAPDQSLRDAEILKLTPFIEQMGKPLDKRKEFWWEREWRYVGDFPCSPDKVVVAFVPEPFHERFRTDLLERLKGNAPHARFPPCLLDAGWGLERMIGELAGVSDLGPFPA